MVSKTTNRQKSRAVNTKNYKTMYIPRKVATIRDVINELNKRGIKYKFTTETDFVTIITQDGTYVIDGKLLYHAGVMYETCAESYEEADLTCKIWVMVVTGNKTNSKHFPYDVYYAYETSDDDRYFKTDP